MSRALGACWLAAALAFGCTHTGAEPPPVRFEDVTDEAGVARTTPTYDAALGDFDADGRPDLYVGNHGAGAVLLRNDGGWRFTDVLPASGIAPGGDQHGAGWADYDNDGRLDLFVALGAGRGLTEKHNRLYHNDGAGRFHDVGAPAGVADPRGRSRAVAWLDVDADGWVDLVLANFASPCRLFRNRRDGTFEDVSEAFGVAELSATRVAWADVDGDRYPDLVFAGTPRGLRLLHNDGGRRFTDVTEHAGLARESAQGIAFGDYDNDGDLDLYTSVGSDFHDVVREDEHGRITFAFFAQETAVGFDFEVSADAPDASATPGTRDGVEADLYENGSPAPADRVACGSDGRPAASRFTCAPPAATSATAPAIALGFALWRDPETARACAACPVVARWHLRWQGAGDHHLSGIIRPGGKPSAVGLRSAHPSGGTLWRNDGRGVFARVAAPSLRHAANGQAVQWADVNDDGWLDLYVVDGGEDGAGGTNRLFLGAGADRFVAADAASGVAPSSGGGRGVGAHFADFDGDGRLDLFLTDGWGAPPFDRGPYRLLRNLTPARHWLELALAGTRSTRQGLGARVTVVACGRTQVRYHDGAASYFSQAAVVPHVGLGDCAEVSRLRVEWPSGAQTEITGLAADRIVPVGEDQ